MPGARGGGGGFRGSGSWGSRGSSGNRGGSRHSSDDAPSQTRCVPGSRQPPWWESASSSPDQPSNAPHACYGDLEHFVDCINVFPDNISVCQAHFDAFMACKDVHRAYKRPKAPEAKGFWEYILP